MSHAVVAIPVSHLSKGKVPAAAVIVGSVSPDFPYLLVLAPTHAPGHSLPGMFIFCLLPSIAVLYVWYRWLENPTLAFWKLPKRNQSHGRLSILLTLSGILVGALSHVLWDATSHSYGSIVKNSVFWNIELASLPIYQWNQYLSGIVGLVLLMIWYWHALMKNINAPYTGNLKMGALIYVGSIASLVLAANLIHQSNSIADIAVKTSIGVMSGAVLAILVYGAMNHWRYKRSTQVV